MEGGEHFAEIGVYLCIGGIAICCGLRMGTTTNQGVVTADR